MKIFIGFSNIASQMPDLKKCFKKIGIETLTAIYNSPRNTSDEGVDYNLQKIYSRVPYFIPRRISSRLRNKWEEHVKNKLYNKALRECDAFIFIWSSFEDDFSDLLSLKNAGKRVISVFVGDDVRWHNAMKQEFSLYNLSVPLYDEPVFHSESYLEKNLQRLRTAEKHSDFIFSRLDQAQLQLRPYYRWNMMVNTDDFTEKNSQHAEPVIVHAPSSPKIKGTEIIIQVLERLKKEGIKFELRLITNMNYEEARLEYSKADIIIDQLYIPGSGKLSTEGLALGKIVLSNMSYGTYPQNNPEECPIIDINPDILYETLKKIIPDHNFRTSHSKKSRPFVEKYLDTSIFCKKIVRLVNGEYIEPDYHPTFFRDLFVPQPGSLNRLFNKYNQEISECGWYKNNVKSGERAGLVF